ncbi:MAG: hypothetical protein JWO36_2305 [Myxococcales bacterium]|nr:hypothetical protein [Myxococcales bacterium]
MIEEIESVGSISRAELDARDRPLRIIGGARAMRAVARWGPGDLAGRIGDVEIAFKLSANGKHPNFHAPTLAEAFARGRGTVREFLALITGGPREERARYLFTGDEQFLVKRRNGITETSPHLAALLEDLEVPAQISPDRLYTIWAWFSGPGVRTWTHYDNNACHNLNAQITGTKTCLLFEPRQLARLAPFPLGGANPAYNCSQLDADTLPPEIPRITTRLEPGDLLFIPAWWLHAFHHLGDFNSNVNWWWKPAVPVENPVSRRQQLIDLVTAAGVKPSPGSAEAILLGKLDAAAIAD